MKPWAQKSTAEKIVEVLIKNAILALATSTWFMHEWKFIFNFDNPAGMWASFKMVGGIIGVHEIIAWGPTILAYAKRNNDPAEIFKDPLAQAQQDVQVIKQQAAHAEAKIEEAKDSQAQNKKEGS